MRAWDTWLVCARVAFSSRGGRKEGRWKERQTHHDAGVCAGTAEARVGCGLIVCCYRKDRARNTPWSRRAFTHMQVQKETCGKQFEELIGEIYLAGAKPLGSFEAERVDKALKDLKLDSDVAVEVLSQVGLGVCISEVVG